MYNGFNLHVCRKQSQNEIFQTPNSLSFLPAADTSIYDEPKFDGANYDNPKMPLVSPDKDFQEGIYNIPAHSQPLNMGMSQNGQPHPSHTVDAFDMGKNGSIFCWVGVYCCHLIYFIFNGNKLGVHLSLELSTSQLM